MNHWAGIVVVSVLTTVAGTARAAESGTEFFASGLSGWTNGSGGNLWVEEDGLISMTFPQQKFPIPLFASIEGGAFASSGRFAGDYTATNIECIGFSFFAADRKPSELLLELTSGSMIMYQELSGRVGGVGTWNHFICPLVGPGSERWVGFAPANIPELITNVTRVAIRVLNNASVTQQTFRVDDIFVGPLPAAAGFQFVAANEKLVTWNNLRTNFVYRMEYNDSFGSGSWSNITTLVATGTVHHIPHTNVAPVFYRLVIP